MFQHGGVAGHQAGRGETKDLPEWKIPWHDRQHDSQRVEGDETLDRIRLRPLLRKEALGVFRVIVAVERAFLDFGDPLLYRLTHLLRHQARVAARAGAKNIGGSAHQGRALGEWSPTPFEEGFVRFCDGLLDRRGRHFLIGFQHLAGSRVDGLHRHVSSSSVLSKRPYDFLGAIPLGRRPNLGIGAAKGPDQHRNFSRRVRSPACWNSIADAKTSKPLIAPTAVFLNFAFTPKSPPRGATPRTLRFFNLGRQVGWPSDRAGRRSPKSLPSREETASLASVALAPGYRRGGILRGVGLAGRSKG